jgi:hypothetical protein
MNQIKQYNRNLRVYLYEFNLIKLISIKQLCSTSILSFEQSTKFELTLPKIISECSKKNNRHSFPLVSILNDKKMKIDNINHNKN